jgi:hypothetical protein
VSGPKGREKRRQCFEGKSDSNTQEDIKESYASVGIQTFESVRL